MDKLLSDNEWKISLFPTEKFSTVSIAVYFYNELLCSEKFEENTLFFYWFGALKKKILKERNVKNNYGFKRFDEERNKRAHLIRASVGKKGVDVGGR
ncbi:hypothetical protein GGR02_000890 [Anoxybacillus voinovskiensis]|uniref:Uncharacterized protein n=1 Tax=Anoxybacteroides voinovskiense TaxID=230470 RepID=A0A840DUD5_9BACL|nr:hypothetical protein [Anoxybacillus voinovskiensis]MBB4073129.1 hypothetical protein [Anoxybacillus voinovskiensis]GGJ70487.1 hypothetical protein GCM10008982_19850 [Anoxybacillus voinovskiensis]